MSKEKVRYLVGTSGWSYPHWQGIFYPADHPKSRWFEYYAGKFSTVEVNATFYRFFKDQTYHNWRDKAPENFKYVLKAPRLITHRKYLKDAQEQIKEFWQLASLLEDRLGLILLQPTPSTPYDPDRLKKALLAFGDPRKIAIEFRHNRWLTEGTRELLQEVGSVFAPPILQKLSSWTGSPQISLIFDCMVANSGILIITPHKSFTRSPI